MEKYEDFNLTKQELQRIQRIIADERIVKYFKQHGEPPHGDLSEFYHLTCEDIEPYRKAKYSEKIRHHHEHGQQETGIFLIERSLTNAVMNSGLVTIKSGQTFNATVSPIPSYDILDENVRICMGGQDITSQAWNNGTLYIGNVTGDISISIVATYTTKRSITVDIDGADYSGTTTSVNVGDTYHAFILPYENYCVNTIVITMGDNDITRQSFHDGEINIANVTGNIRIVAKYKERTCKLDINGSIEYIPYGSYVQREAPIVEQYGYDISARVIAGNIDVTDSVYTGGILTISSITNDVTLKFIKELHKFDITIESVIDYSAKTEIVQIEYSKTYSKTIKPQPGYGLYRCACGNRLYADGKISFTVTGNTTIEIDMHEIPGNEMLYFNVDGEVEQRFIGVDIVSNTIENGIGILRCAEDITGTTLLSSPLLRTSTVYLPNSVGNNIGSLKNSVVKYIYLPSTTTQIPNSAFSGNADTRYLYGLDNVTSIGNAAFCSAKNIYLPSPLKMPLLTSIGDNAFANCSGSTAVIDAPNLISIGGYAFRYSSVNIGKSAFQSLKRIGIMAFANKSYLNIGNCKFEFLGATPFYATTVSASTLDLTCLINSGMASQMFVGSTVNASKIIFGDKLTTISLEYDINCSSIQFNGNNAPSVTVGSKLKARQGTIYVPEGSDYSSVLGAFGINWKLRYISPDGNVVTQQ